MKKDVSRRAATTKEIIEINRILSKVIRKNKDGTVYYKDGETDESIARKVGNGLSHASISRVRKELFGQLRARTSENGEVPKEAFQTMLRRI